MTIGALKIVPFATAERKLRRKKGIAWVDERRKKQSSMRRWRESRQVKAGVEMPPALRNTLGRRYLTQRGLAL